METPPSRRRFTAAHDEPGGVSADAHHALAWDDEQERRSRRLLLGETGEAAEAFADALAVCHEAAAQDMVEEPLLGLAAVAVHRDERSRAARLAGAATAHRTALRSQEEDVVKRRLIDGILAPARDDFGAEAWDNIARAGASLSVEEAIELGLAGARPRSVASALNLAAAQTLA